MIFGKYLDNLVKKAHRENKNKILRLLDENPDAILLDLGCNEGTWAMELAKKIKTNHIHGVDIVKERLLLAEEKGISVEEVDLNGALPYESSSFDVVHSNQVIEHLYDTDRFLEEIYRVLKPGGYAIISSENLASWHNVFSLILGFQPFSMSNYSNKGNIGNPFSLWNDRVFPNAHLSSWKHLRLFSYFGLKDLLEKHGFVVSKIYTSGYYPSFIDFSFIDKWHGHWIVFKVIKKSS